MTTEHAKGRLQEDLAAIETSLAELGAKDSRTGEWVATSGEVDSTATEPDELADRQEETQEHQGEIAQLTARREEIVGALSAIEMGIYGTCGECGEPIEEARLEANPAARTCSLHA